MYIAALFTGREERLAEVEPLTERPSCLTIDEFVSRGHLFGQYYATAVTRHIADCEMCLDTYVAVEDEAERLRKTSRRQPLWLLQLCIRGGARAQSAQALIFFQDRDFAGPVFIKLYDKLMNMWREIFLIYPRRSADENHERRRCAECLEKIRAYSPSCVYYGVTLVLKPKGHQTGWPHSTHSFNPPLQSGRVGSRPTLRQCSNAY